MAFSGTASFTEDSWYIGPTEIVEEIETILSGQTIEAREPLGRVTASGKWVLSDPAAEDGSEVARAFAPEAIDASGGDVSASLIKAGRFDQAGVNLDNTDHTLATIKADLEGTPLFIAPVLNTSA